MTDSELIHGGEDPIYVDGTGLARNGIGAKIENGDAFPIYHWSPHGRYKQIVRSGIVPGSLSVDRSWRPPHTCWSDSPSLAWALSGQGRSDHQIWDLWMTWSNIPTSLKQISPRPSEFRVFERIFKRDIWHVGTRS